MSNIVLDIRDSLKTQIEAELPNFKLSKFAWDFERNNDRNNDNIYAVRPQSASNVRGTNQTITLNHDYDIYLSSRYKSKGDNDIDLDEVIMSLYEQHEKLEKMLFRRKLNIQRVLVVESVTLTAPQIDYDNHTVSIVATYTIKYRNDT